MRRFSKNLIALSALLCAPLIFSASPTLAQSRSQARHADTGGKQALDARLFSSVKGQDAAAVKALIAQRADVNATEVDGATPLLWAAYSHNVEITNLLIKAGAHVDTMNRYGITPLLLACRSGDKDIVFALLKADANPSLHDPSLETPLMAAAGSGLIDVVNRLIKSGADVNAKEPNEGQTALMWAAEQGHTPVIEALLKAGADPNVVALEITPTLTRKRDEQGRQFIGFSAGGFTALMFAARQGRLEAARALADSHADLNHANPDKVTALILAVLNDELDLAAMLIDHGVNANDGSLYELVQLRNAAIGSVVSADTSRPRVFSDNKIEPLELMKRMLKAGADPYFVSGHIIQADSKEAILTADTSAYMAVLRNKDVRMLNAMLESGAAKVNVGGEGKDPPLYALVAGGTASGGGLVIGAPDVKGLRYPEGPRNLRQGIDLMLQYGADVTLPAVNGATVLHLAAQQNNVDLIREFHSRGAKLDAKDAAGLTPLDHAMGKRPPAPPLAPGARAPAVPQPQPNAVALLRELMKLPPLPAGTLVFNKGNAGGTPPAAN